MLMEKKKIKKGREGQTNTRKKRKKITDFRKGESKGGKEKVRAEGEGRKERRET